MYSYSRKQFDKYSIFGLISASGKLSVIIIIQGIKWITTVFGQLLYPSQVSPFKNLNKIKNKNHQCLCLNCLKLTFFLARYASKSW